MFAEVRNRCFLPPPLLLMPPLLPQSPLPSVREIGKGSEVQVRPFAHVATRLAFLAQTRQPFRSRKFESLNSLARRYRRASSPRDSRERENSKDFRISYPVAAHRPWRPELVETFARIFDSPRTICKDMQVYIRMPYVCVSNIFERTFRDWGKQSNR